MFLFQKIGLYKIQHQETRAQILNRFRLCRNFNRLHFLNNNCSYLFVPSVTYCVVYINKKLTRLFQLNIKKYGLFLTLKFQHRLHTLRLLVLCISQENIKGNCILTGYVTAAYPQDFMLHFAVQRDVITGCNRRSCPTLCRT